MDENALSYEILQCAFRVHNQLGPGLLESSYQHCLYYELAKRSFLVEKEKPMPLVYEAVKLDCGYRIDLLVNKKVVVEAKSVDGLNDVHLAQILTYLKLGDFKLGLLINFNVLKLKTGIRRVANGM